MSNDISGANCMGLHKTVEVRLCLVGWNWFRYLKKLYWAVIIPFLHKFSELKKRTENILFHNCELWSHNYPLTKWDKGNARKPYINIFHEHRCRDHWQKLKSAIKNILILSGIYPG